MVSVERKTLPKPSHKGKGLTRFTLHEETHR